MAIRLADVLAALSHALDLTGGQPRGHAERTCVVALRLAEALDLTDEERSSLFYAALLKDAGCSSTAARVAALYGADDHAAKRARKAVDFASTPHVLAHLVRHAAPGAPLPRRAAQVRRMLAFGRDGSRSIIAQRCERSAAVAEVIGLPPLAAAALREVDERWDGRGAPLGLAGDAIRPIARVLALAQAVALFWENGGPDAARAVAHRRSGTAFDPAMVRAFEQLARDDLWAALEHPRVRPVEPATRVVLAGERQVDRVAKAFAHVIDAKSPFTARHSAGVAELAVAMAAQLGRPVPELRLLRRAGLLHDIGKLGVSNRILDKDGPLDAHEWALVRRHPEWSLQVLQRIPAFAEVASVAAAHHERLDGSGYWRGLGAERLSAPARILAVADVAEALTADRPYRPSLDTDAVLRRLRDDAGRKLDADAVEVLEVVLPAWRARRGAGSRSEISAPTRAPAPMPAPAGA